MWKVQYSLPSRLCCAFHIAEGTIFNYLAIFRPGSTLKTRRRKSSWPLLPSRMFWRHFHKKDSQFALRKGTPTLFFEIRHFFLRYPPGIMDKIEKKNQRRRNLSKALSCELNPQSTSPCVYLHPQKAPGLGSTLWNKQWQNTRRSWLRSTTVFHKIIHIYISVACAIGPSVTTSSTDFSFQNLVWPTLICVKKVLIPSYCVMQVSKHGV